MQTPDGRPIDMNEDAIVACADLASRSGAANLEIGYLHDDVPLEQAGWYAAVRFRGIRVGVDDHTSPTAAATALAERLLYRATCRCSRRVVLSGASDRYRCRWSLIGRRWEPGCDAAPVRVEGKRGDYQAMTRAMADRAAGEEVIAPT